MRIAPAFHFYFTAVSSDAAVQARLDAVAHFPVPYRKAIVAEAKRIAKVLRGWFGNYSCAHLRAVPGTPTGDLWIEDHTSTDDTSTDEVDRTPVQFAARVARAGEAFVVLRHVAGGPNNSAVIDPGNGMLRVAALQYV